MSGHRALRAGNQAQILTPAPLPRHRRCLDTVPELAMSWRGILGGARRVTTWNHRFELVEFDADSQSFKLKHVYNWETPSGETRYHADRARWFSEAGIRAIALAGLPIEIGDIMPPSLAPRLHDLLTAEDR